MEFRRILLFARHAAVDIRDGPEEARKRTALGSVFIRLHTTAFARVRSETVDRLVMKKASRGALAPCDIGS